MDSINESIELRNKLESLPDGEKLLPEAIEGLAEALDRANKTQKQVETGAVVARKLNDIRDVNVATATNGQLLSYNSTTRTWVPTTRDLSPLVTGPASAVNNSIPRYSGTTGKIIKGYTSGAPLISDTGRLSLGTTPTGFTADDHAMVELGDNVNDYRMIYIQNRSNGDSATSDFVCGADNDTIGVQGRFIDVGICGSGYSGITSALGIVKAVSVTAGGTGYQVGNVLTLATGDADCTVRVLTLSGSAVATVAIENSGNNYTTGTKATTGGTGTGCTINVVSLFDLSGTVANDGYVYVSGGNLTLATDDSVANKNIKFFTNGQATANERARIDDTGLHVMPVTAVPAGGAAATGLRFSSVANLGVFFGSGVPTLSAAQGSLYIRTDGSSTTTRMYVNTNGTTGWTHVVTGA